MIEALSHSLRDLIRYAPPFFLLIIVIELATLAPSHHRVRHGRGGLWRSAVTGATRSTWTVTTLPTA